MWRLIKGTCSAILVLVLALLVAVQSVAYDASYIAREVLKLNTPQVLGMSEADVYRYAKQTAGYLSGVLNEPNIKVTLAGQEVWFLNEREVLHMHDVRHLFLLARYATILLLLTFLLMGMSAYRRGRLPAYLSALSLGALGGIAIAASLVLLVRQDFNHYFTQFHVLSFANDLWLLDPATDRLINLLPEPFFARAAGQTVLRATGLLLLLALGGLLPWQQVDKRQNLL